MADYSTVAAARTRASLRWNYSRGNIWPGPAPVPPIEPIEESTLAAIRRSLRAEPGPVPETTPSRPPRVFGNARHLQGNIIGLDTTVCISWPTPQIPYEISDIVLSAECEDAGPAPVSCGLTLHPTQDDLTGVATQPLETQVFPTSPPPLGPTAFLLFINTPGQSAVTYSPHAPVDAPTPFLTAYYAGLAPLNGRLSIGITLREVSIENIIIRPLIIAPQVLTRSLTAAPLPAGRPASTPRGLKISVLQAGRPIYSRDIAWASADVELKKQFLNAQLSGVYPPTLQPIW